jgi:hypothetical protein
LATSQRSLAQKKSNEMQSTPTWPGLARLRNLRRTGDDASGSERAVSDKPHLDAILDKIY